MTVLLIVDSHEHGNTRKVAEAMADAVGGKVVAPRDVAVASLDQHDLVGFGSGVRFSRLYPELLQLVERLPYSGSRRAFVFSTSGTGWKLFLRPLRKRLEAKGFRVVGQFACKGLDTMGLLWLVGGINKGRPSADDLRAAADFARRLAPSSAPRAEVTTPAA
jgi:flavodoxin